MRKFILLLAVLFLTGNVYAIEATHVISNSENWEDVYSSVLYANLNNAEGSFLTSTEHGSVLLDGISISNNILIVSSQDSPFVFNYEAEVQSRNYVGVQEIRVESANLELIDEMSDVDNFIIVGNDYGYNAIAVAPYAILTNSWVFLADRVNIAEIDAILSRRDVDNIVVYGYVDREVADTLQEYDPVVVDTGNRFKDNIEIVKMYKEIENTKQILLSNGEFIEREIMLGGHPILFTGRDNVPEQIANYLKDSDIEIGVLIGNELINAATNIRRSTGLSVMVKFAQGARSQVAGVSAVEGLDLFYLPVPTLELEVYSIKYNLASSQVEVSYHSKSNVPIYIKGTLTALSDDDEQKFGDMEPVFIAPSDYKTLIYPDISLDGSELKAEIFTLFGEVPSSLDRSLRGSYDMGIINVIDKCEIDVNSIKYNKQAGSFYVKVSNIGDVNCYVDIELRDVEINRIKQTIGTEGSVLIMAGDKDNIEIKQRMDAEDLADNPYVDVVAYYGEREESLVNIFRKGNFELDIDEFTTTTYLIALVLILLVLIGFYLWRMKQNKEW
ncbi:hypothetical protein KAI32_04415 [Candidatus Pacearchaeota archaeon]|nr:hypothetical protein [Candidatus Pacearchaeota archaeon]